MIRREDLTSNVAGDLIAALNAELSDRYPEEGATHFRLDPHEVAGGRGAFFVAYHRGRPVSCGAVRRLDDKTAEIKRMYVVPDARGQGFGRRMLEALEAEASELGAERVVLETGDRQGEAVSLYESAGYAKIPPFGEYVDSPVSICVERRL